MGLRQLCSTLSAANQLFTFRLVFLLISVVGVVFGLQGLPLFWLLLNQELDHTLSAVLLFLTALAALGQQGIGQAAFQFIAVGCATALIDQTLEVVGEQAVRLQDAVQVDVVILGGVLVVGGGHDGDQGEDCYEVFHFDLEESTTKHTTSLSGKL
jgi:hypothetical protein